MVNMQRRGDRGYACSFELRHEEWETRDLLCEAPPVHGVLPTAELHREYFAVRFSSEIEQERCVGSVRFTQGHPLWQGRASVPGFSRSTERTPASVTCGANRSSDAAPLRVELAGLRREPQVVQVDRNTPWPSPAPSPNAPNACR